MFAASNFEFKSRFWIFGALFWFAFATYSIDPQNAGAAIVECGRRLARSASATAAAYHAIFAVGALFCIAAAAVRTWGTAYLNPEVMVDARLHTSRLVADGPYRYVRNPLYFGNILLAIGFGLMSSRIGFAILVLGMIFFDYRLILREEAGILAEPGRELSRLLRRGPALAPCTRAARCRRRDGTPQLGRWIPGRSIHVGAGAVCGGLRDYLESAHFLRRAGVGVCGVCDLLRGDQDAAKEEGRRPPGPALSSATVTAALIGLVAVNRLLLEDYVQTAA